MVPVRGEAAQVIEEEGELVGDEERRAVERLRVAMLEPKDPLREGRASEKSAACQHDENSDHGTARDIGGIVKAEIDARKENDDKAPEPGEDAKQPRLEPDRG